MPWLLLTGLLAQAPSTPVEPLMRHAVTYVATYEQRLGGLVAEEDYEEREFSPLRPTRRRTVRSDYVLIIRQTRAGGDAPASGTFWIRVSDGAILKTTLRIGNPTPASVEVQYCTAPRVGMLVPCTMIERYDSPSGQVQNTAKYTNVRRFDVAVSTTIK